MKKILLPVDGSDCSLRAVNHAVSLLNAAGAEIHLLNVQPGLPGDVSRFVNADQIKSYHHDEGVKDLQAARAALDKAGVKYQFHISVGDPAEIISRVAKEQGFDQIVMGTHGRGGLAGMLLGSVASKTLAQAPVPVLVVK